MQFVCLFDGQVVPFTFAGVESGDTTFGHRFMAPGPIQVRDFADYRDKLYSSFVEIDASERRKTIEAKALRLAEERGLRLRSDPGLLDELKGLVEWPVPLIGRIDEASMALPAEVLTTSMRTHQRYLALESSDGSLAPWFITVANIETPDQGATIVAGNEYVLRARLWDARFFWEQDRKRPLESYLPGLDQMVFHAELGSLGQRVERLVALAGTARAASSGCRPSRRPSVRPCSRRPISGPAWWASFPSCRGSWAGTTPVPRARTRQWRRAIAEHYAPKGPDDRCPSEPASVVVALAEKLDTLAGFFAADIKPTGSKDPFALRRAALRRDHGSSWRTGSACRCDRRSSAALDGYGDALCRSVARATIEELLRFFADRLKVHLRGEGVRHDLVSAVFAVGEEDDLVRLLRPRRRAQRVPRQRGRAQPAHGLSPRQQHRRDRGEEGQAALRGGARSGAAARACRAGAARGPPAGAGAHRGGTSGRGLCGCDDGPCRALRAPVDEFFDRVMVNADEPELRANRLRLLGLIRSALGRVADFGLIEDVGP